MISTIDSTPDYFFQNRKQHMDPFSQTHTARQRNGGSSMFSEQNLSMRLLICARSGNYTAVCHLLNLGALFHSLPSRIRAKVIPHLRWWAWNRCQTFPDDPNVRAFYSEIHLPPPLIFSR